MIQTGKSAQILKLEFDKFNFQWNYISQFKQLIYNGEFDPGSGWTLAAGLIHASRGAARLAIVGGDRQTGAEHVRNLPKTDE